MYYVLTLFNLNCNSKALCSNHCILLLPTLPHLLYLFIYPGCPHTSFGYLYNPAHKNRLHQKNALYPSFPIIMAFPRYPHGGADVWYIPPEDY